MPGIFGLITRIPREQAEAQLMAMRAASDHGGSFCTDTWIDEPSGLYLGWSTRKNSHCDGMPLYDKSGKSVLVLSGEEYSQPQCVVADERRRSLGTHQPSYLSPQYENSSKFPNSLNGRFHGVLFDQNRGAIILFNDRYGLHRLYYHESRESFYFAAEAKAILNVRPELRKVDARGLGEFISCGCVLENRTLFDDIRVLPPASAWTFRNGLVKEKRTYFQPQEWEEQEPLDLLGYYKELRDVFSRSLPRYLRGQQRIAMSLTGGLDSRLIMAWTKSPQGSLPCYSFGGMFRDCQDVRLARQVANACQQSHQVIRVGHEFLSRFAQYAKRAIYLTDGCVGVSRSVDLYLNEHAAEVAPVRMTGNYGGEVLRRVRPFKPTEPSAELFCPEVLGQARLARETYSQVSRAHPVSFAVFRQAPWYHYGLLALEETQVSLRTPYLDNDLVRTVFRAPKSAFTDNQISLKLIADSNAALLRIPTDRGLAGGWGPIARTGLRALLEFTFKAEYIYDYGMPHWLARIDQLFSPIRLENLFLGRHKFSHFRVWYRRALSEYIREMLLDPRTLCRPYLRRNSLENMVRDHVRGDRNYTAAIHQVLTLELIHRLFIDSMPETPHVTSYEADLERR